MILDFIGLILFVIMGIGVSYLFIGVLDIIQRSLDMCRREKLMNYLRGQVEGIVGKFNKEKAPEQHKKLKEELERLEENNLLYDTRDVHIPDEGWVD